MMLWEMPCCPGLSLSRLGFVSSENMTRPEFAGDLALVTKSMFDLNFYE